MREVWAHCNMGSKEESLRTVSGVRKPSWGDKIWHECTLRILACRMNREYFWNERQPRQRYGHEK